MALSEPTRIRLGIMEARYGRRLPGASAKDDDAERLRQFDEKFRRIRAHIIVPALEGIGEELAASGHRTRIELDVGTQQPSLEFYVFLRGTTPKTRNLIRLFSAKAGVSEIIAEVDVHGTLTELTRYRVLAELTKEVAEQMFVDALEHIFACNAR